MTAFLPSVAQEQADSSGNKADGLAEEGKMAVLSGLSGESMTKPKADSAYMANDYVAAIQYYEELLAGKGESADVYYNLGNSYYKTDNIAKAILNYERALLLKPGDGDIRFNLEMARSKTVDKVDAVGEVFFIVWLKDLMNLAGADGWGVWGIASFLLFILALVLFVFGKRLLLKKIGFGAAVLFLFVSVVTNIFAFQQKKALTDHGEAIVISPSITVRSTPSDSGTELFILHEGHKVGIKDNSMKGWKEIMLDDGNVGWIPATAIEII